MGRSDIKSPMTIGFLSIFEHEQQGLVGGYLILNAAGRPLEFHCTAPIKPSRAQQILYGPTLLPYLYGEQIGQTLLAKAAARPRAVCTDVALALSVRSLADVPVALVLAKVSAVSKAPDAQPTGAASEAAADKRVRCDRGHSLGENVNTFHLGPNHLAVLADQAGDRAALEERLAGLLDFDLCEPFDRIHEAVEEAHKAAR